MYQAHFKMTRAPFERDLPVTQLFSFAQFEEALARVLFAVSRRSLAVITGEVGSGKSTLLRALVGKLPPTEYHFAYIADSHLAPASFYDQALRELSVAPAYRLADMKRQFRKTVSEMAAGGKIPVLAIDEAQELLPPMLQELKFILNFDMDSASPLAVILCGQSDLRAALRLRTAAAVMRRIQTKYHLTGLEREELGPYITHQLAIAGCPHPLFLEEVIQAIYEQTKGAIWHVNRLCQGCLLDAFHHKQLLVDMTNLNRVIADLTL